MIDKLKKLKVFATVSILFVWLWLLLFVLLLCFIVCAMAGDSNSVTRFCTKALNAEFDRLEYKLKQWLCVDES